MKYEVGQKVNISIINLAEQDSDLTFVDLAGFCEESELYNDLGELCCLNGEECVIDHVVVKSTDRGALYDLLNCNGETAVHFILSEMDLDIAVLQGGNNGKHMCSLHPEFRRRRYGILVGRKLVRSNPTGTKRRLFSAS